jgi:cellulose synthase operon protein YhjU
MGLWNYYFIAKLALFFAHFIGFHRWENLGFALALLWPIHSKSLRVLRQVVAVPLGVALLYYDSWLPSIYRLVSQAGNIGDFSFDYLLELLGRFINGAVVLALVGLLLLVALLGRRLRITTLTMISLLFAPQILAVFGGSTAVPTAVQPQACLPSDQAVSSSPVVPPEMTVETVATDDASLNAALEKFYGNEAKRKVSFPKTKAGDGKPFDIIFLHICSLSWDDMSFTHEKSQLLNQFHILFSNFNSASTYSGPAVIRLLRGSCGQTSHNDLYGGALPQCYLFNQLSDAGFTPKLLMNHDGHFGDFLHDVQQRGGLNIAPLANKTAPVRMYSFDGTPIYDDLSLLNGWWDKHLSNYAGPVALFYNTISLHDGNKIPGVASQHSLETYPARETKLLADLEKFIANLERSGRQAVVVLVAEHGAALRSDPMQISGMREIPSPKITLVPAAIRLVGLPPESKLAQVKIAAASSYLGLSTLLARLIETNPFSHSISDLSTYTEQLPQTEFVAENEQTIIMRQQSKYYMHTPDNVWMEYAY